MKLSKSQRENLKQKFGGYCAYCGDELGGKWHPDHLIAVVRDLTTGKPTKPENDVYENLMPACTPCNHNKRSMSLESWRDLLTHYRDVQVIRDCSQIRHLLRFGLVQFIQKPVVFHFEKWMEQPKSKYNWSIIPEHVQFMATDEDGMACGWLVKPQIMGDAWRHQSHLSAFFNIDRRSNYLNHYRGDWKDSLEQRPEEKSQ
ncbi:hypothetical protein F896_01168 [Acinetobacter genomosp. 15BJ]|uniref:HNH nuclease domain-containing protein n=1 Tax=Acinetobacter genomosp. 15BJ TaxID=106651 RepID=R9B2J1_9GAMM|nr:hypothetical protein F896_01168 [Acinetobacter genomosp. 15BJ]